MATPMITTTPLTGAGPGRPLLVVGPSLGTTTSLWGPVATGLTREVEVLGFDLPGHGSGPVTTAPYTVTELADGVLAAVDRRRGPSTPFCYAGDSLGGAVGLALAVQAPGRVQGLAPMCTGARIGEPAAWHERAALVRAEGVGAVVDSSRERWFAPGFVDREPQVAGRLLDQLREVDAESYALACEALAAFDLRAELHRISAPTVVVSGALDVAAPPDRGEEIAAGIVRARHLVLDGVGHLAPVEASGQVIALLRELTAPMSTKEEM